MSGTTPPRRRPAGIGIAVGMCVGAVGGVLVGAALVGSDASAAPLVAVAVLIGIVAGFLIGAFVDLAERPGRR